MVWDVYTPSSELFSHLTWVSFPERGVYCIKQLDTTLPIIFKVQFT